MAHERDFFHITVSSSPVKCSALSSTGAGHQRNLLHPFLYPQVDAWAVGILAYELLVGYPPFEQESRAGTYEHIMYKDPYYSSSLSPEAKQFIAFALVKVR